MKTVNVVLYNFIPPYDTVIRRMLQEKISKVHITTYNHNVTRDECIDLLLCFFNEKNESDERLWDRLKCIHEKNLFPVILISQNATVNYYNTLLKIGLSNSIAIPCSKSFLFNKIESEIHKKHPRSTDRLIFDAHFIKEQYSIQDDNLAHFISSIVENLIHHNDLLQKRTVKSLYYYENAPYGVIIDDDIENEVGLNREKKLWEAFDRNEFELYYQPIISLDTGVIIGFESLLRWNHPQQGVLNPDEFIPAMEQSEIIFPLGLWIIEQASKQVSEWNHTFNFTQPLKVNINLSAKQFVNHDLAAQIISMNEANAVDPRSIVFEITESAFMSDMEAANLILLELRANKYLVYLDDFGTGYSSLSYLMHFPVDVLKIDKSFVKWMHIDEQSLEIVKSVIGLAHNLKMKVVAEGIEAKEHLSMLKEYGCDYGQGYYFSKPLRAADATELLARHKNLGS